jgi:hypothetical protein
LPSLCWHVTAIDHTPPNFGGAASTWSTARPPSSHAVRASGRSEQPRSRTDATSSGSRRCLLRSLLRKTREASFGHRPSAGAGPCGRPQLGVRRVRRLLMRSEPAVDRNGHAPALIDVLGEPMLSPSIDFEKDARSVVWASSKCGSPPLWIGRGGSAAWEDGGRAVLQVRLFACGSPPRRIGRGGSAAWEDGGRAVLQVRLFVCGRPPRRIGRVGSAAWEGLVWPRNQLRQARGL